MCRRVQCRTCGKPTYVGCGRHVEQVLADVPKDQRCACTPAEKSGRGWGFFHKLFGRG
ncbi:hypothetical protein [Amycolatopsis taiwanensis]|uniref:Uncharacterized protein n=1 Tax=Amycolatopsis taiwanensis TaxID=342230 RepID=A0A9W6VEX6_9PSEU|nr:hypothetical protein [Amycolatopsis taiwanensis]GLY64912.1 hypothetical protein Atai01_15310 [Amycolatopsis taiwanensis]